MAPRVAQGRTRVSLNRRGPLCEQIPARVGAGGRRDEGAGLRASVCESECARAGGADLAVQARGVRK